MITLENISTSKLYSNLWDRAKNSSNESIKSRYLDVITLLSEYNVEDYQSLKDLLDTENPKFNILLFKQELKKVEKRINEANILGIEPEIYIPTGYSEDKRYDETLKITDDQTLGNVLLMTRPIKKPSKQQQVINRYSISELKFALSHLQSDLRNDFRYANTYFKKEDMEKLITLIKFYESQVLRQIQEIEKSNPNLLPTNAFKYNEDLKQEIVESQLKEIAEYLVDSGTTYIWGSLSDLEKQKLIKVVKLPHHFARRQFITAISDYTTLTELEQGIVKKKTLDRFIVK